MALRRTEGGALGMTAVLPFLGVSVEILSH